MFSNINEVQVFIKENNIKFVDFKVVTLQGRWNHLTIPAERLSEKTFSEGIGLRKDGKNLFFDEKGYSQMSETALYFIGGILKHSKALLAFTNPSTNS